MTCRCSSVPQTLSYTDPGYDALKATLVECGRDNDDILMRCRACGKRWTSARIPFMHADVDILAEDGFPFWAYWTKRITGH